MGASIAFDLFPALTIPMRSVLAHITIAALLFAATMLVRELCGPEKLGLSLISGSDGSLSYQCL